MIGIAKLEIHAKALLFADDIVLYHSRPNLTDTTTALQLSVSEFIRQAQILYLQLAPQKCTSVIFTYRPYNPLLARIQPEPNQQFYEIQQSVKYLGIILDSKLNWKQHTLYLRDRAFSATHIFGSLSPTKWSGDSYHFNTILQGFY